MTKKLELRNSHSKGERGSFYFPQFLMTLKKSFPLPAKFYSQHLGQAAMEYFIILSVVLALALLSASAFYPQVHQIITDFYNKTAKAIMDSQAATQVPPGCGHIDWQIYEGMNFRKEGSSSSLTYDQYHTLINCSFTTPTDWGLFCSQTKICPGLNDSGDFQVRWKGCEYNNWRQCDFKIVN